MRFRTGAVLGFFLLGLGIGMLLAPRRGQDTRLLLRRGLRSLFACPVEPMPVEARRQALEQEISAME